MKSSSPQLPLHQIEHPERLQVFELDEVFTDDGVLTYQAPSVHGSSVELRERGLFLCILRFQVLAACR